MAGSTKSVPKLKTAQEVRKPLPSANDAGVFSRELKPYSSPNRSGSEVIAEMRKLSSQDIFIAE